jgi:diacylglycerol kinase family enzyme
MCPWGHLDNMPHRVPAIVNLRSGSAKKVLELLEGTSFEVFAVEPDAIADTVREVVQRGARRVLVAGGDGTIATAAGVLIHAPAELAVLPAGTLNHFARDLGISTDPGEALKIATGSSVRAVDVGVVEGRVFLNTSSVGAYVGFVRMREQLEPRFGYGIASFIAAFRLLFQIRLIRVEVEVDGTKRVYHSPLVFVGVGERALRLPNLGNRIQGGKRGLHVLVVQGRPSARVLALELAAVARGANRARHNPKLDSFMVDELRLDLRRASRVAVDGELVTPPLVPPLTYLLKREALHVVCPPTEILAGEAAQERREAPREGAPAPA